MKTAGAIAALVALGCAHGFVAPVQQATTAMRPQTKRAAERVNESIELEKPKVCQYTAKPSYCRGLVVMVVVVMLLRVVHPHCTGEVDDESIRYVRISI